MRTSGQVGGQPDHVFRFTLVGSTLNLVTVWSNVKVSANGREIEVNSAPSAMPLKSTGACGVGAAADHDAWSPYSAARANA